MAYFLCTIWVLIVLMSTTAPRSQTVQSPSPEQAVLIARSTLGGVVDTTLVAEGVGGAVYIAVMHRPYQDGERSIQLLRSIGSAYARIWDSDGLCGSPESLDLRDVDDSGVPEVLFESNCGGNAADNRNFYVYDIATERQYVSTLSSFYSSLTVDVEIAEGLSPLHLAYVEARMAADPMFVVSPVVAAHAEWTAHYGAFADGREDTVVVNDPPQRLYPDQCPNTDACSSLLDSVELGSWTYRAFFKGAVYAVNTQRSQYVLLFVSPLPTNSWVDRLSVLDGYLLLSYTGGREWAIAYDPQSRRLAHLSLSGERSESDDIILDLDDVPPANRDW